MTNVPALQQAKTESVEFMAYVRKEGKITVPKEVRDTLGIKRNDLVRCRIAKVNAQ